MKENYLITIKGTMEHADDSDCIELLTKGSFFHRNGKFFISYCETEATGYNGCITTVKVDSAEKVSMLRTGPAPSRLIIEKGKRHICHYETGFGSMSLGVSADDIKSSLTSNGGTLRFSYLLDTDTTTLSRNIVDITVRAANE